MALFRPTYTDKKTGQQKQSAVWWYEFSFAGRRIRESAKTSRKTIAAEAEKQRRLQLERAMAGLPTERPESRIRSVSEALATYAKSYPVNHRPKSAQWVNERSVPLKRLLGSLLGPDITRPEPILDYMEQRQQEGVSHRTINNGVRDTLASRGAKVVCALAHGSEVGRKQRRRQGIRARRGEGPSGSRVAQSLSVALPVPHDAGLDRNAG
jgi:hypothetical protein